MGDQLRSQMRFAIVPVDVFDFPDLSVSEQMVYIVLQSYCNAYDNTAFPSYETIARKSRITRRHAINCVQSLINKGLLLKEERKSNKDVNVNTSNLYMVRMPKQSE